MSLETTHPALNDLRNSARKRIPHFVWEYLDSATGDEATQRRNRTELDKILLKPGILHGEFEPDLSTTLMGRTYPLPFGIAPVGMSGLIWPNAECLLAKLAADTGIPYGLSTVASQTPETVGPHVGDQGWFQLYPPRDPVIRTDILNRAKNAGFHTLVLTVDVPVASRRERQARSGLTNPPRLTPRLLAQVARCPTWALGTLKHDMPRLRLMESYQKSDAALSSTQHIGYLLRTSPDWDYLRELRAEWDGKLVVKGVLNPVDAQRLQTEGVDAVWISNHAGRQFAAAPAAITALPHIRDAVGPEYPLIFDSGINGGLDILRAIALGANFVMLGRAFHYGLGAFGAKGAAHVVDILRADLQSNMGQIGARQLSDIKQSVWS
ncbi:alpha-hydroxy acid dehydrogenase [Marinosulfonomonas sp. PRT-SC04]|nr:alpha-hydroxy acid dehydrogenase [Marinosulfonomonas sp. PRT-SC04]